MKTLIAATVLAGFVLVGCKKADKEDLMPQLLTTETAAAVPVTSNSGWTSVSFSGGSPDSKGLVTAEALISSESFSDELIADGLVLVFSKDDQGVNMLPFQDASIDWNYTVSKGLVAISAVSSKAVESAMIRYVVIPSEKLAELEKSGYTRNDLVNIAYEKAQVLFGLQ